MPAVISPARRPLIGTLQIPGDKSLSHRALMFGALAEGTTQVHGLLPSADVQSTAACLRQMGVQITSTAGVTEVYGVGLQGLQAPDAPLDCGNSGTTMRLMMGLLAGQQFATTLIGDPSLSRRPMGRVATPLREMGAQITLTDARFAPVHIQGTSLHGISYALPVASAQVKSALLLAGLYAAGTTQLTGLIASRDHTERLLPWFGVPVSVSPEQIVIHSGARLKAQTLTIPGDPSSAAFWVTAAALVPGSHLILENVLFNPGRIGLIQVLQRMGANITLTYQQTEPESVGRVEIRYAPLRGTVVGADEIPALVDEVPLLALLATQAQGRTEVRGAEELRVKESDRLAAVADNLRAMGAELTLFEDGFWIDGPQALHGATITTHADHRIAMTFALAALIAASEVIIPDPECAAISYPSFFTELDAFTRG